MTEIFELRIWEESPIERAGGWTTHSAWDTEANALEAARGFGFHKFGIQPRRVMNAVDLRKMGESDVEAIVQNDPGRGRG